MLKISFKVKPHICNFHIDKKYKDEILEDKSEWYEKINWKSKKYWWLYQIAN